MQGVWTSRDVGGLWGSGGLGLLKVSLRTHLYMYVQITTGAPPGGNDFRYIAINMNVYGGMDPATTTYPLLLQHMIFSWKM